MCAIQGLVGYKIVRGSEAVWLWHIIMLIALHQCSKYPLMLDVVAPYSRKYNNQYYFDMMEAPYTFFSLCVFLNSWIHRKVVPGVNWCKRVGDRQFIIVLPNGNQQLFQLAHLITIEKQQSVEQCLDKWVIMYWHILVRHMFILCMVQFLFSYIETLIYTCTIVYESLTSVEIKGKDGNKYDIVSLKKITLPSTYNKEIRSDYINVMSFIHDTCIMNFLYQICGVQEPITCRTLSPLILWLMIVQHRWRFG